MTRTATQKLLDFICAYALTDVNILLQKEDEICERFKIEKDGRINTKALIECVIEWEKETSGPSLESVISQKFTITERTEEEQAKIKMLMGTMDVIKSGYAGILPNGNIVDRREHPTAIPCQENPLFNTPKPKKL